MNFGFKTRQVATPIAGLVGQWLRPRVIKSIQTGSIALANGVATNTAAVTLSRLDMSVVFYGGVTYDTNGGATTDILSYLTLGATTVAATRDTTTNACSVAYTVVEFWPGIVRSVQRGTIAVNAATSNTATITAVDTTRAFVIYAGNSTSAGRNDADYAKLVLTNATTVTASRINNTSVVSVPFQVLELWL